MMSSGMTRCYLADMPRGAEHCSLQGDGLAWTLNFSHGKKSFLNFYLFIYTPDVHKHFCYIQEKVKDCEN